MVQQQRFRSEAVVIAYLAFLGTLMATGIDISLPAFDEIDADLDAGGSESLIVTLYFLGAAFGQLVAGPVSDAIGRQRTLLAGLALYVVGGAACALAPSYGVLLAARFVWGLGAAAPTGIRTAIARDLYSGDRMARVTTIMMAVFLLGPIFIPLVGEALLAVGPWQLVFWFATVLGAIAVVTAVGFGETLPPERRRPLQSQEFADAVRLILATRVTLGHILANVFWSAAFFIFLGSSQPVFDRIFGRADQFAFLFAAIGAWTIPLLLVNNRLIERIGSRRTSLATAGVAAFVSVLGLVWLTMVEDDPSFWLWFGWVTVAASFITLTTPPMYALALDPMGDLAGTVSALLYFTGFAAGSGLAALFDALIDDSVTPFVAGFALYGAIALVFQLWARPEPTTNVQTSKEVVRA